MGLGMALEGEVGAGRTEKQLRSGWPKEQPRKRQNGKQRFRCPRSRVCWGSGKCPGSGRGNGPADGVPVPTTVPVPATTAPRGNSGDVPAQGTKRSFSGHRALLYARSQGSTSPVEQPFGATP